MQILHFAFLRESSQQVRLNRPADACIITAHAPSMMRGIGLRHYDTLHHAA
ncbi:MAG TPA: hypothetical protein PKW15_01695 [Alphaproteobacteria bacterium]|nr:hypothetical protein [Alphaproteobacteria bacterium]